MKVFITFILTLILFLTACNQKGVSTNKGMQADTANNLDLVNTTQSKIAARSSDQVTFKNVKEVVQDKKSHPWVNQQSGKASCALHFNLDIVDTLCIEYSAECWVMFPFKTSSNNITVYWDKIVDSKYDFNIVKTIAKIDPKYSGKPFMILELINDTTLTAKYPYPELIKKLNNSTDGRILFPDKYFVK